MLNNPFFIPPHVQPNNPYTIQLTYPVADHIIYPVASRSVANNITYHVGSQLTYPVANRFTYPLGSQLDYPYTNLGDKEYHFWEITGNSLSVPSYIFGTLHILGDEYLPQIPKVIEILEKCQTFVAETIGDNLFSSELSRFPGSQNLTEVLGPFLYAQLMDKLTSEGISYNSNLHLTQPYFIMMRFMAEYYKKTWGLGRKSNETIDKCLEKYSREAGKKLVQLDSLDDIKKCLVAMTGSLDQQVDKLNKFINFGDEYKMRQSLTLLYQNYCDQKKNNWTNPVYSLQKIIFDNRNHNWMPIIVDSIKQSSTFIAVGQGHLPGHHGLINLLRQHGYTLNFVSVK